MPSSSGTFWSRGLRMILGLAAGLVLLEGAAQTVGFTLARLDDQRRGGTGGDTRVLCLGACYTLGLGGPPEESYPFLLEERLRSTHPDRDIQVVNGGVRGKSVDHFSAQIDSLLEEHQPDVLVVNVNRRLNPEALATRSPSLLDHLILPRVLSLALDPTATASAELPEEDPVEQARRATREDPGSPEAWKLLTDALVEREELESALEAWNEHIRVRPHPSPVAQMRRFSLLVGLGRYDEAHAALLEIREKWPRFSHRLTRRREGIAAQKADPTFDATLRGHVDDARLGLLADDLEQAEASLNQALDRDPDTADAWALLGYVEWRRGGRLDPSSVLAARASRALPADVAMGLTPESVDEPSAAEARLEELLRHHLSQIHEAAEARGVKVLVENLASLPPQQRALERVTEELGLPLVDLQGTLVTHPDREVLFHGEQHLRLSAEGNRWLAEQLDTAIEAQGWLQ